MKFFIDESLPAQLAIRLNQTGHHDAFHLLHVGRRGAGPPGCGALCRRSSGYRHGQRPRLPSLNRQGGDSPSASHPVGNRPQGRWRLLETGIEYLETQGKPADAMVNHAPEIDESGAGPAGIVTARHIVAPSTASGVSRTENCQMLERRLKIRIKRGVVFCNSLRAVINTCYRSCRETP